MQAQDTIAVAGDWHGDGQWAGGRVMGCGARGISTILHVGDFGIWPGPVGKKYLTGVENACARSGVTILVTPGNHEDWDRIDAKLVEDRGDGFGAVKWLTDHVAVLPRAHRWTMTTTAGSERSFVSLGGAPSIDFEYRTAGRSWWPSEMMTADDVARTVAGGHADVMITHDAPGPPYAVPAVEQILASNPMGWSLDALAYAGQGRRLVTEAYEGVRPKVLLHGHYHAPGRALVDFDTHRGLVVSLDQQMSADNMVLLDLGTLTLL